MRPRSPSRSILGILGAVLTAALVSVGALQPLGWADAAPTSSIAAIECDFAVTIEGELRCDAEVGPAIAELCPKGLVREVQAGDALDALACRPDRSDAGDSARARMPTEELAALGVPIDVNTATREDLRSLPGIGPRLAERIVAGRPYGDVSELTRVRGIGPKTLRRIQSRVRVQPLLIPAATSAPLSR